MKRILVSAIALLTVAGCASAPPTVTQRILGTWTCDSNMGGGSLKGVMTYAEAGKTTGKITFTGAMNNQPIVAAGDAEGTWELLEKDTKLKSTISNLTVTSLKVGERDMPVTMAQAMLAPLLVGQSSTAAIVLEPAKLTLTAEDNTVTTCTR